MPHEDEVITWESESGGAVSGSVLPWKVMIVDDEPEVHQVTRMALSSLEFEGRPLEFIDAYSGQDAREKLQEGIALILLDVVMEEQDSGLQIVNYVRNELKQYFIRIILRTGQPGTAPENQIFIDYDINDYKSKTELTSVRLISTVVSALRGYRDLNAINNLRTRERAMLQESERTRAETQIAEAKALAKDELIATKDRLVAKLEAANTELSNLNAVLRKDLEAAAEIQRGFLPSEVPRAPGIEFSWYHEPGSKLGGDTLNIRWLDENHIGFYMLDVGGHGVPAALMSVALSRSFMASADGSSVLQESPAAGSRILQPGEVAERLNGRFAWTDEAELYFTLFYGLLNTSTLSLKYVLAGHTSPILLRNAQSPLRLEGNELPVGLEEGAVYDDEEIQLKPGDRLVAYSDALIEMPRNMSELFGEDRLEGSLLKSAGEEVSKAIEMLLNDLSNWRGESPLHDDISLLAVSILGD